MENESILEVERRRLERILQLRHETSQGHADDDRDTEVLEIQRRRLERILQLRHDASQVDADDDRYVDGHRSHGGAETFTEFTFNSSLPSLHAYLGELEDVPLRRVFLDGGAIVNLPIHYQYGIVLFPEATLPLRVVRPNFIAAIERVLSNSDAPNTLGVIHISLESDNEIAYIGTTAEIRQLRRLEDGSINLLTIGRQRFHLRRQWMDELDMTYGEVQIIEEDFPLRTPRDALDDLAPRNSVQHKSLALVSYNSGSKLHMSRDEEEDPASNCEKIFERDLSSKERKIHLAAIDFNESSSSSYEKISGSESEHQHAISHLNDSDSLGSMRSDHEKENEISGFDIGKSSKSSRQSSKGKELKRCQKNLNFNRMHGFSRAFWPFWVYSMYDAYYLAQKAAALWKQIVGAPNMDDFVKNPGILSFYIARKLPVYESTRQELLETDGISYRLYREIEILQSIDIIQCKNCQTVIAKHTDMLAISSEGPLGVYVDPYGCAYDIITLHRANGLVQFGRGGTDHSWFPGYARIISICITCQTQLGWHFTAIDENLKPRLFWGIRSSHINDGTYY